MKELVVISGKGGTGKTTFAASFAALAQQAVFADCDVDAADLHLLLHPKIHHREEFRSGVTAVIDAENHKTAYTYDDMRRVVAITSPDTGTTRYAYDPAGNLTGKTDAKGIAVSYDYDDLNRLTAIRFPDSAENIGYSYDAGTNGIGRRTGMSDPSGSTSFGYDGRGRLVSKISTINNVDFMLSRLFTAAGRVQSVAYPSGRTLDIARHANNGRIQIVRLFQGGSTAGTQKVPAASLTGTPTDYDYGGAADTWGATLIAGDGSGSTDVNNTNFGFGIGIEATSDDADFAVDAMWIKVYYTT